MESALRVLKVFIATPNDLLPERQELKAIVEKINKVYTSQTNCRIELLGWEDTLPGQGRPQDLINRDLDKSNLFIGCLYQRWGTNSGRGQTGFEEEFNRAISRRQEFGHPEIWLFFKKVDELRKADPGEQLAKVLEFRHAEINAKRLLFKEFETTSEWKELLFEALHREMLKFLHRNETNDEDSKTPESSPHPTESTNAPKNGSDEAKKSILEVLSSVVQELDNIEATAVGENEDVNKIRTERLHLYASANYESSVISITLGVHELNRIYLNRAHHVVSSTERAFLLKSLFTDIQGTIPGWFWVNQRKLSSDIVFGYFCIIPYDSEIRRLAIEFATRIGYRLNKGLSQVARPIEKSLKDENGSVRLAAIRHLAIFGIKRDLKSIEQLLVDSNEFIREAAERCLRQVNFRINSEYQAKIDFSLFNGFDSELLEELKRQLKSISSDTLRIALRHPDISIIKMAGEEILSRGDTIEDSDIELIGSHTTNSIIELAYRARIQRGESVDLKDVREKMDVGSYLDKPEEKGSSEKVIESFYQKLDEAELWTRVARFDNNSPAALSCLGLYHPQACKNIRTLLLDKFESAEVAARNLYPPDKSYSFFSTKDSIASSKENLMKVALKILAEKGHPDDRKIFLSMISDESTTIGCLVSCCRGLATSGKVADLEVLKKFWVLKKNHFAEAPATRSYLIISPNLELALTDVLTNVTQVRMWVAINHLIELNEFGHWKIIEPCLRDTNDDVRRFACIYALHALPRKRLLKILEHYLQESSSYYYNVVSFLDRMIYAPPDLIELFSKVEDEYFRSKKPAWERYWSF